MPSFEKKLEYFLRSAVEHRILQNTSADELLAFAQRDPQKHQGWFSLSTTLGGLGGLVVLAGTILLISSNWYMFSDPLKFSVFLALLGGTHLGGLYFSYKDSHRVAGGLHLLGAGLFIAGVGLIAQIFNLYSNTGEVYLIWAAMIAPLAFFLRSGPVALLTAVALWIWGNIYIESPVLFLNFNPPFSTSFAISTLMLGLILKSKNHPAAPFLQVPAIIALIFSLYFYGFSHRFGPFPFEKGLDPLTPVFFGVACVMLGYLWIRHKSKEERSFLMTLIPSFLMLLSIILVLKFGVDKENALEHFAFGWTREIYIGPLFITAFAWVAYFALAFWGMIYGALSHQGWMLNINVILLGVGIFTRFIDLIGTLMNTGIMMVVCGIFLLVLSFVLERWRRRLIKGARP